ncbi:HEAT repeat domain-containing protein [Proteocatella sphenisci]|uniref:HEAT repeat domain-containing protein n=1 Tax=Proteocatella sphenisci TaxID=181070 RepID=UPI00048AE559|nr:HEAT repeat domain-containing protein [Proteocatella sphenisci]
MNYQEESYKLYKAGKNISEISKILEIDENQVRQHIIDAKLSLSLNIKLQPQNNTTLKKLLLMEKADRINFLQNITFDFKKELVNEISVFLNHEKNNAEDLSMVVWIIGELKLEKFNDYLKKLSFSYNGNIKRMAFSSMGKIYDEEFIPYLKQGCKDNKPQVRSYAIKSFSKYNTEDKIDFLRKVYKSETVEYNKDIILRIVKEG